jgi:ferredoxin/mono/diheme cytochrome c family protein
MIGDQGQIRFPAAIDALDRATVRVEQPVRRLAGSARLNPLPHAGTISVFLLGLVILSGLYITLFFEYGHTASYESVAAMEGHAIQRVVRALHRYSSAALVLTSLVHAWRILVARRFSGGQRRYRWATGVASVALVWLAGVTGYWLVWDVRAQALNDVVIGLFGGTGPGARLAIGHLGVLHGGEGSGPDPGAGSGFLLLMWFAHLTLTAAIGYFVFRHLRRTTLPWLPPRHMMAVMGIALLVVSIALPLGMLSPAQADQPVTNIPIDPFVLFLLPPLSSSLRWVALAAAVVLLAAVLALPKLLRRRRPPTIVIDEAACTGCDLCVIDCPYRALTLVERSRSLARPEDPLAAVDASRCVGCGICIGSCAFGAIALPGFEPLPPLDPPPATMVLACDRHRVDDLPSATADSGLHLVGCAGMVSPPAIRALADEGVQEVQVVGCAPNDCRYGIGNSLAADRLSGRRSPHPAARHARIITQDWIPGDRLREALKRPGNHPDADGTAMPARREALVGVGVATLIVIGGVALATRAPFQPAADPTALRVVVDHQPGRAIASMPEPEPVASLSAIKLLIDDQPVATVVGPDDDGRWSQIIDLAIQPELRAGTEVVVVDDELGTTLFRGPLNSGSQGSESARGTAARTVVAVIDVPTPPTVADGREIFNSRVGGCSVCHSVKPGDDGVGPSLAGVASVAQDRVDGLSAEQYLWQSIVLPDQYVVDGWPAGQMLPIYRDRFSDQELDAVIRYLLTLEEPAASRSEQEDP